MPAGQAPVPGLRTTRVLLLLPLIALLYFAGWNSAGNAATPTVPTYDHIFFVIDENHSRTQVMGPAPYLTALAKANEQSSTYFAVTHPSVNNYMALFSGQTYSNITDGCTVTATSCSTNAVNIADKVKASGRTAKGYMETMPSACYLPHGSGAYTERHNPFPYFNQIRTTARCAAEDVPYSQLASDLSSTATTPNFAWISPNLQNDMHDGSVAQGDAWAKANFPTIFNSPAWKTQHSLLVFTTDEDDFTTVNNVPFIAVSSDGSTKSGGYVSTVHSTHYSWLRTIESAWGLSTMTANDAAASPMTDLFVQGSTSSPTPSTIASPSPSPSPAASPSPSPSPVASPSASPSPTANASPSPTPTATSVDTPALVQVSGAVESSASSSLTANFPTSTSAGHLLVLSASVYTGITNPITSVSDPTGNAWTRIGTFAVAGHYSDGEMWYASSARATTGVTIHLASPAVVSVAIEEFSGVTASSPLTASLGSSATSISPASGSLTPTAGDLVVGFVSGHSNPQAIGVTAAGFTVQGQRTSVGASSAVASVVTGYKVLSAASAEASTGSFSSSMYWAAGIADFKAATTP